jgi:uncharacterized protein DUF6538
MNFGGIMATVLFLPRDRTSLYVRVFIPRTLQHHFRNKRELWRTLQTLDASEAAWKAASVEARVRRVFHLLHTKGDHMTKEQIEALIEYWLEKELDEAEEARAGAARTPNAIEKMSV